MTPISEKSAVEVYDHRSEVRTQNLEREEALVIQRMKSLKSAQELFPLGLAFFKLQAEVLKQTDGPVQELAEKVKRLKKFRLALQEAAAEVYDKNTPEAVHLYLSPYLELFELEKETDLPLFGTRLLSMQAFEYRERFRAKLQSEGLYRDVVIPNLQKIMGYLEQEKEYEKLKDVVEDYIYYFLQLPWASSDPFMAAFPYIVKYGSLKPLEGVFFDRKNFFDKLEDRVYQWIDLHCQAAEIVAPSDPNKAEEYLVKAAKETEDLLRNSGSCDFRVLLSLLFDRFCGGHIRRLILPPQKKELGKKALARIDEARARIKNPQTEPSKEIVTVQELKNGPEQFHSLVKLFKEKIEELKQAGGSPQELSMQIQDSTSKKTDYSFESDLQRSIGTLALQLKLLAGQIQETKNPLRTYQYISSYLELFELGKETGFLMDPNLLKLQVEHYISMLDMLIRVSPRNTKESLVYQFYWETVVPNLQKILLCLEQENDGEAVKEILTSHLEFLLAIDFLLGFPYGNEELLITLLPYIAKYVSLAGTEETFMWRRFHLPEWERDYQWIDLHCKAAEIVAPSDRKKAQEYLLKAEEEMKYIFLGGGSEQKQKEAFARIENVKATLHLGKASEEEITPR